MNQKEIESVGKCFHRDRDNYLCNLDKFGLYEDIFLIFTK